MEAISSSIIVSQRNPKGQLCFTEVFGALLDGLDVTAGCAGTVGSFHMVLNVFVVVCTCSYMERQS